jgi:type IV secretion system protein VirB9
MKPIFLATLIISAPLAAHALQNPQAYKDDLRVKHVPFQENNVVKLAATTFTATQILFSKNETVLAVEGGDNAGWMVTFHENLPNMIFVKPTLLRSNTNMTVITNKHNYYFHAFSNKSMAVKTKEKTYAIKFTYPEEEKAQLEAKRKARILNHETLKKQHKDPKTLNWNYRFSGNSQIMPTHVYDDGKFTYFELQKNQAVPAIFAVDDKQGKESIVNTRREGDVLIVQRLAPQFTLRHGGLVASVFNTVEIARIKQGRR